jgi:S-adenosylmethionine:tRNA ribosyltransferase-isomerase
MSSTIDLYDYVLPKNRIAQTPAKPRESAKLMILDKAENQILDRHVQNLPDYIRKGDVVVINNTKVFHARLFGQLHGRQVECFLVRPEKNNAWITLGKPGKKFIVGDSIEFGPDFSGKILRKNSDGTIIMDFDKIPQEIITLANLYGQIPIPPYIKTIPKDDEYQTIYAKRVGSVAAPTAGFHLTENILSQLKDKGVTIVEITLHVGLGTFMPIKSATLEAHTMHTEEVEISENAAQIINEAKKEHRRVIAIGTTTVRTLEGVASMHKGKLMAYHGYVNIFITPGYQFHVIDGLLTNFHLPKSTLLVLVSALAGREKILTAYHHAIEKQYRFFSFGDAMLITT